MKIPHIKFTPVVVIEMIAIMIFFFWGMAKWSTGMNQMKYYRNYKHAIDNYSSGRFAEVTKGIARAEKAKIRNKVSLSLFKANFLTEQKKYAETIKVYQEIEEDYSAENIELDSAKVGKVVCKLYQANQNEKVKLNTLLDLNLELTEILEKETFSDAFVVAGHIALQIAECQKEENALDKMHMYRKKALSAFEKAEELHHSKLPLSKNAAMSLYLGNALLNYRLSKIGGTENIFKNTEEITRKKPAFLLQSVSNLRKAMFLRLKKPVVFNQVNTFYTLLLTSVMSNRLDREKYTKEAELTKEQALRLLLRSIYYYEDSKRKEMTRKWQEHKKILEFALGSSYFFLEKEDKAQNYLMPYYQEHFDILAKKYKKAVKEKAVEFSREDFIVANNYITLLYKNRQIMGQLKEGITVAEKIAKSIPTQKFYIEGKTSPINAPKIFEHNLFRMYENLIKTGLTKEYLKKVFEREPKVGSNIYKK